MQADELTLRTSDAGQTRELAGAMASLLLPGDVVSLSGELGAGKTCFVQGAALTLGVERAVTSPTFLLVRLYEEATPPVVHCDVYRLDRLQDVADLGDEVMADDVVTFVEWGDAIAPLLPDDRLDVEVLLADGARPDPLQAEQALADAADTAAEPTGGEAAEAEAAGNAPRLVRLRPHGGWMPRLGQLREASAPWVARETDR